MIIDIRRADVVLFRAAMMGSTPDQADWIEKKSAVAFRFQASSLLVGLRMASADHDPFAIGWLDLARHTLAGGAFPIRAVGAGVVAVATVSGLSSDDDHTLIVEQLREHKVGQHADIWYARHRHTDCLPWWGPPASSVLDRRRPMRGQCDHADERPPS